MAYISTHKANNSIRITDLRILKDLSPESFANIKALVYKSARPVRSNSPTDGSWVVELNGRPLASARNPVWHFASLDFIQETLSSEGVPNFIVVNADAAPIEQAAPVTLGVAQ